jgi:hypothetical protein
MNRQRRRTLELQKLGESDFGVSVQLFLTESSPSIPVVTENSWIKKNTTESTEHTEALRATNAYCCAKRLCVLCALCGKKNHFGKSIFEVASVYK